MSFHFVSTTWSVHLASNWNWDYLRRRSCIVEWIISVDHHARNRRNDWSWWWWEPFGCYCLSKIYYSSRNHWKSCRRGLFDWLSTVACSLRSCGRWSPVLPTLRRFSSWRDCWRERRNSSESSRQTSNYGPELSTVWLNACSSLDAARWCRLSERIDKPRRLWHTGRWWYTGWQCEPRKTRFVHLRNKWVAG